MDKNEIEYRLRNIKWLVEDLTYANLMEHDKDDKPIPYLCELKNAIKAEISEMEKELKHGKR